MIIRKATESDIPEIIELLKISLGESLIPKSEVLWKWKHLQNPFGKSPVLIAEEGGTLIGVRAFLRWEFLENGKIHKACRAVDTATHPDYQGKGIFKNLTLSLIEDLKNQDVELIFNTPNSKSTPGYLKMDWEKWGKLPLKLNFHFSKSGKQKEVPSSDWDSISKLIRRIETTPREGATFQTRIVPGYLHWRFRDNPLFPYQFLSDGKTYLLVYRIKDGKMGREFRICDLLLTQKLSKVSN
jgi:N-acetylglutamate synthase-like GNAT family acetyltransferase